MIVSCEKCGRKYNIDIEGIKGERGKFRCEGCGEFILVEKSSALTGGNIETLNPNLIMKANPGEEKVAENERGAETPRTRLKGVGLRWKLLFFLIAPLFVFYIIGAYFSLKQMGNLSNTLVGESSTLLTQMAERQIAEHARGVALQVRLFLLGRAELKKEDFQKNSDLLRTAVQKVGATGYTCLYSIPDERGISSLWLHPNEKLIGIDMPNAMKKDLGNEFPRWWKIYEGAYKGQESQGYYAWRDADGQIKEKFMVCSPVGGTNYVVASTTYLEEFTLPVQRLKKESQILTSRVSDINIIIMIGIIVIIGVIVFLYAGNLTRRITSLSDVANRISMGELDVEIVSKSKDEIGQLAESISRMQESVRLAIERLRHRR